MNIKHKLLAVTGVALVVDAGAAMAHHSIAQYEEEQTVTINGTVTQFFWTNPHVWIFMNVEDAQTGEQVEWRIEAGSPVNLARRGGWEATVLEPGQEVTAILRPMKDGTPLGHFLQVTTNGTVLSAADGY